MSKEKSATSRRDFLKLAGTTVPAAAVAVAGGAKAAQASEVVQTGGLQKTEHVQKYLDSARF